MTFGGAGGSETDANAASFYVVFSDERTMDNEAFAAAVAEKTADLNCEVTVDSSSMDVSALMGNGITIQLFGKERSEEHTSELQSR